MLDAPNLFLLLVRPLSAFENPLRVQHHAQTYRRLLEYGKQPLVLLLKRASGKVVPFCNASRCCTIECGEDADNLAARGGKSSVVARVRRGIRAADDSQWVFLQHVVDPCLEFAL